MNKGCIVLLLACLCVLAAPTAVLGEQEEAPRGKYYTLVDDNNNIVLKLPSKSILEMNTSAVIIPAIR